jgi:hypothetical protein
LWKRKGASYNEQEARKIVERDGFLLNLMKIEETGEAVSFGNVILYKTADKTDEKFPIILESRTSGQRRITYLFHIEVLKPEFDDHGNVIGFIKTKAIFRPTSLFAPGLDGAMEHQKPGEPYKPGTIEPFFGDGNVNGLTNQIVWIISRSNPKESLELGGFFSVQIPTFDDKNHALAVFIVKK